MTDHGHGRDRGDALGGELVGAWVQTWPLAGGPVFAELEPVFLLRFVPLAQPPPDRATGSARLHPPFLCLTHVI